MENTQKNYIEQDKVYPESEDERVKLSSFIGKQITNILYDPAHNKFEFWTGNGRRRKLMFAVTGDDIYDVNGNYLNSIDLVK